MSPASPLAPRKPWHYSSSQLFPWSFNETESVHGEFSADGSIVSGMITADIEDQEPIQYQFPPTTPPDRLKVPAPGWGSPTDCSTSVYFSAAATN